MLKEQFRACTAPRACVGPERLRGPCRGAQFGGLWGPTPLVFYTDMVSLHRVAGKKGCEPFLGYKGCDCISICSSQYENLKKDLSRGIIPALFMAQQLVLMDFNCLAAITHNACNQKGYELLKLTPGAVWKCCVWKYRMVLGILI